jgi:hypothetical protein
MIEVYASRLSDEGKETYEVSGRQTLLTWLHGHGISLDARLDMLPLSLYLNGDRLLPAQWGRTYFTEKDHVEIYREPKGTDPFSITFALIAGAKAVLGALMPKIPGIPSSGRGAAGEALDEASAKGNKIKLNEIRPECLGYSPARYPDLLTPGGRRYFVNGSPREQRIEMLLGVGVGEYEIPLETVRVGETPLLALSADDAQFAIYGPGEDLSADPAHMYWYLAPEVGASSTGAAGLELTVESTLTPQATAQAFTFNGNTVSIAVGAGSFPSDWTAGLTLGIGAPYAYTVADGTGTGGRDVITGPVAQHGFAPGDLIEIQGQNSGLYEVFSVTPTQLQLNTSGGAPATGLVVGSVTMAIGYRGLRWRILTIAAQSMTVEQLDSAGAVVGSWPGWDSLTSNQGRVILDPGSLEGGYRGPFPACPEGELITAIEWDVFFPAGLVFLSADGARYNLNSYHSFEYRDMAIGGAWTAATYTDTWGSLDAVGFTHRIVLPYPMRPECRAKKIFVNQGSADPENEQQDNIMWYGLKGLMASSSPTSYDGLTTLTVDIRGGDRVSSQTETLINLACTRVLPVLRGGAWQPPEATREISAAIGYIIRNVGYSDTTDIDLAELSRLEETYWTPRGDWYDRVITKADTVKSFMQEILRVGFSEMTIDRGVLTPVRDGPRGPSFDSMYNPQIMLEPLLYEFKAPNLPDEFDGVDVEYLDQGTRQVETIECRLPGDAGSRVEKIKIDGVSDPTRAWRLGMRQRRSHLYRQKQYSFKTELDALNSGYWDYSALGVSTPGYGQSAELRGYQEQSAGALLESAEILDWSTAGVYYVLVRRRDGTASGPYLATRYQDSNYLFTIPVPLDFVPDLSGTTEPPIIQFGHEAKWVVPALITDVSPSGTRTCSVKAVGYDVRMYADDDNFPPEP